MDPRVCTKENTERREIAINVVPGEIIAAAMAVHTELGPGLLEFACKACLACELIARGLRFERRKPLSVAYGHRRIDCGYRVGPLVEYGAIVEIKAVRALAAIHEAQLLSCLKFSSCHVGLLINFNGARKYFSSSFAISVFSGVSKSPWFE